MSEARIVTPGEKMGKTEEYLGGENTFVSNGEIYAEVTGTVETDGRKIQVKPSVSTPPVPRLNDVVVGKVFRIRNALALVRLSYVEGNERREIPSQEVAALHISNLSQDYVDEMSDVVREGDIVKARVTNPQSGNIDLTTAEPGLGVVSARCQRDSTRLRNEDGKLVCPECGREESRKVSEDYR
ncbi:MAG: Exosome complex component Csl4 [Methanonatronarchaeales archaeon]|nr:Exosome complex component Csl4 [Methanonatronarchaeales archaeon]